MKGLIYLSLILFFTFTACDGEYYSPNLIAPVDPGQESNQGFSTPCGFDFNSVQENDTLRIECSHDLDGQAISLPKNVVINYNGGKIINGTFVFNNGKIDGRLLNHQLEVSGNLKLSSPTFKFEKNKWDIVEGEVDDERALQNKEMLQKVINDVKAFGADTFEIDELDAYFKVTSERNIIISHETSIRIPSDFSVKMSDNSHLRVQPNQYIRYNLLDIRDVSNVKITGGNLYGDREQHNYENIESTHEWGHLINIASGVNIDINNVNLSFASGDGLNIHSTRHTFDPKYIGSEKISISDCVFNANRRNNLSITDGSDILIEYNTFLNAGIDMTHSKGTAPRYGIDIEAVRAVDDNGELIYYQRARDITIKNNTEKGGANGAFLVAIGEDVNITNNTTEHTIAISVATRVKITNNTIEAGNRKMAGISAGLSNYENHSYGNEISSNTIIGHATGIHLWTKEINVSNNKIKNCKTGIALKDLQKAEIFNNTIENEAENPYGVFGSLGGIDDVNIYDNNIMIDFKPIIFTDVNTNINDKNNIVKVLNNNLNGGEISIHNSYGIVTE